MGRRCTKAELLAFVSHVTVMKMIESNASKTKRPPE